MHYRAPQSLPPYNCLSFIQCTSSTCVLECFSFSMCVDLAILIVVMEDVAPGASWPEESWFNEHH